MKTLATLTTVCLFITACSNAEIGNIKDVNPATVYTKYYVYNNENDESTVRFRAQFTFAGPNGTSLVLNAPARIELDGDSLTVDSTDIEGAFYEVKKTARTFNGEHTVTFINIDGKAYTNHFRFNYFTLQTMPAGISGSGTVLTLNGLSNNDSINVRVEDTSDATNNIDTLLAVNNNNIILPAGLFIGLTNGPITIQVGKVYDRPLEHTTPEGGSINFIYTLAERNTQLKK